MDSDKEEKGQSGRALPVRGDRIRKLRNEKLLSQQSLAKLAKCSLRTIRDAERGNGKYKDTIINIARALGVDATTLIAGSGSDESIENGLERQIYHEADKELTVDELKIRHAISESLKGLIGPRDTVIVYVIKHACVLLGTLSLVCGFSGCIPINAKPLYIAGFLLGLAGIILAIRRKSGYTLPTAGVVVCGIALILWPTIFGLIPTKNGYRIGTGWRQTGNYWQAQLSVTFKLAEIPGGPRLTAAEKLKLRIFVDDFDINWQQMHYEKNLPFWINGYMVGADEPSRERTWLRLAEDFGEDWPLDSLSFSLRHAGPIKISVRYGNQIVAEQIVVVEPYDGSQNHTGSTYPGVGSKEFLERSLGVTVNWTNLISQ